MQRSDKGSGGRAGKVFLCVIGLSLVFAGGVLSSRQVANLSYFEAQQAQSIFLKIVSLYS